MPAQNGLAIPGDVSGNGGGGISTPTGSNHHHNPVPVPVPVPVPSPSPRGTPAPGSSAGGGVNRAVRYTLRHHGAFPTVEILLARSDGCPFVKACGDALISMHDNVEYRMETEDYWSAGCCNDCDPSSTIYLGQFYIRQDLPNGTRGDILLAPPFPGEIMLLSLSGEAGDEWHMSKSAFLACDSTVSIGLGRQMVKTGWCCGYGGKRRVTILRATGAGRVLISSFGNLIRHDLGPGERRKIDNEVLVAWQGRMTYNVATGSRAMFRTVFSRMGMITQLVGPGTVYAQSRSVKGMSQAIAPYTQRQDGAQ